MSQPAAGFGAIHGSGREPLPHRGRRNEHAADGLLVVQVRRLGTISGQIPELATHEAGL